MRQKPKRAPAHHPSKHRPAGEKSTRGVERSQLGKGGASLSRSLAAGKEGRAVRKIP
jgi:hypothetical protein